MYIYTHCRPHCTYTHNVLGHGCRQTMIWDYGCRQTIKRQTTIGVVRCMVQKPISRVPTTTMSNTPVSVKLKTRTSMSLLSQIQYRRTEINWMDRVALPASLVPAGSNTSHMAQERPPPEKPQPCVILRSFQVHGANEIPRGPVDHIPRQKRSELCKIQCTRFAAWTLGSRY